MHGHPTGRIHSRQPSTRRRPLVPGDEQRLRRYWPAILRGPGGADRPHAPRAGRGAPVARRARVLVRAELLHAASGPRGHAACDLFRLASARHAGRPRGGPSVSRPRRSARAGALDLLRGLRQDAPGCGAVHGREGRRARDRDRGFGPPGPQGAEGAAGLARSRRGLRRALLFRRPVPLRHYRRRHSRVPAPV